MESPGSLRDLVGLIDEGLDDFGVAVALIRGGVPGQEIEVPFALDVPNVDALSLGHDHWQRSVVVANSLLVQVNIVLI